jgi:hypothetical protein
MSENGWTPERRAAAEAAFPSTAWPERFYSLPKDICEKIDARAEENRANTERKNAALSD